MITCMCKLIANLCRFIQIDLYLSMTLPLSNTMMQHLSKKVILFVPNLFLPLNVMYSIPQQQIDSCPYLCSCMITELYADCFLQISLLCFVHYKCYLKVPCKDFCLLHIRTSYFFVIQFFIRSYAQN